MKFIEYNKLVLVEQHFRLSGHYFNRDLTFAREVLCDKSKISIKLKSLWTTLNSSCDDIWILENNFHSTNDHATTSVYLQMSQISVLNYPLRVDMPLNK